MPSWINRLLNIGVVDSDSQETVRNKRLFAGIMWISMPMSAFSLYFLAVGQSAPEAAAAMLPIASSTVVALMVMKIWPNSFPGIVHLIVGGAVLVSAMMVLMAGGLLESGLNIVWGFLGVILGVVIFADRRATVWLVIFVVSQVIVVAWAKNIEPVYVVDNAELQIAFNLTLVGVMIYFILYYYVQQRAALLKEADDLLLNILPEEIAEQLKASDDTIAESFESVSVLFADVVDFTPMSAGMGPDELVGLLDEVFSAIDALVDARDLEKIKTIGDAYMVAAGVPHGRPDHAEVLCDLALEIQQLTEQQTFGGHRISFRIGINSGPVVAGIIGTKKFSYDLWGDTVNVASRMESSASSSGIRITAATARRVSEDFVCESLGTAPIKGRGEMEVFALLARR